MINCALKTYCWKEAEKKCFFCAEAEPTLTSSKKYTLNLFSILTVIALKVWRWHQIYFFLIVFLDTSIDGWKSITFLWFWVFCWEDLVGSWAKTFKTVFTMSNGSYWIAKQSFTNPTQISSKRSTLWMILLLNWWRRNEIQVPSINIISNVSWFDFDVDLSQVFWQMEGSW